MFILIFYVYDSKLYIIYDIPFILRLLVLVVTCLFILSHWVCFFSHHNGILSPSPSLIVIFCHITFFSRCWWVQPLVGISNYIGSTLMSDHIIATYYLFFLWSKWHRFIVTVVDCYILNFPVISTYGLVQPLVWIADYIGNTLLRDHIIAIYHHCFYPSIMSLFCRHCCWLLYFEVFLWFLPMNDCDHSLGFLITLKVLCWAIIFSLYCYVSLSPLLLFIYIFVLSFHKWPLLDQNFYVSL